MKLKTDKLTDAALNFWTAKAAGLDAHWEFWGGFVSWAVAQQWDAANNWEDAGPLIIHNRIALQPTSEGSWMAYMGSTGDYAYGPTPQVAAMRCLTYSKFGAYVDHPEDAVCEPTPATA